MTKFAPIHPGEILQSEFLDELGIAERVQISKQVNTGTPTGTGYLAVDRGRGSLLQGQFFTQLYAPLVERVDSPNDAFYEDFVFVDGY